VVGSLSCAAILTRLEIDHTPLDLIVIDAELKLLLGRPWLTMAIDRCSRMPMGFYISFNAPSSHSVMQCLKRSILPKTEWLAKFPEVRGEWPVFGIPEQLACDNGMDLHSNALESTCSELLITLFFCPSKGPEWKGAMERFFRTMNVGLIHQLPGTVFSNVDERGDYPAEEKACIDIKVLVLLLTKWIVDVYAVTPHRGIGTTPLAKWSESAASRTIELPAYPLALDTITGIPAKRTLFHYGVELEGLHYNSRQLQAIRGRHGESIKADLKFTEETVGYIHVFDPDAKEYIKVDAIAQDYAANLPRQVHRLIRERTRARFGDNLSTENLLEARAEIEAIISEAIRGKKMALRKEGARFMMIDSEAVLAAAQPLVAAARPLRRAKAKGEVPRSVAPGLEDELPSYSELSAKKPDPAQG
jgi:putative transposase